MTTARSALRVAASHLVYDLALGLACLVALPAWLVRAFRDDREWRWARQRLWGRLPEGRPDGRPVWIHAVSVGEVRAARPLVAALRDGHPDLPLVISTGTVTGYTEAQRCFPDLYVCHAPIDLPPVVRKTVRALAPRLIVLLELEVWPSFMRIADELGVPQVILNGRITEGSFVNYHRLRWWLPEYDRLAAVAAQDEANRERFAALGVPPERLSVTGNLKQDRQPAPDPAVLERLRAELGLPAPGEDSRPVFLAGSTHEGEDEPAVRAWRAAGGGGAAHMLLVPRHLERLKDIRRLLRRLDVPWRLRSEPAAERDPGRLVLVDTIGELETLFALADVVFLGGSLVPVGGHNVLEPAAAGCPVLVGPHLESCRAEADLLAADGALEVVPDAEGLVARLADWLADAGERERRGRAAREATGRLASGAAAADVALLQQGGWLA